MASWVITISRGVPEHWEIAKGHGFWDVTRNWEVAFGDLVYFWQGNGSWLGQARATDDLRPLARVDSRPWIDGLERTYVGRFPFELLSDSPTSRPAWGEVQSRLSRPLSLQAPRKLTDPADEAVLSSYFSGDVGTDTSSDDVDRALELARSGADLRRFSFGAIADRRGQAGFRRELLRAYGSACGLTGESTVPVLEAAHISPYKGDHTNHVRNGLLLRADVHTLFDLAQVTVDPELVVHVSPELRGSDYAALAGRELRAPSSERDRPDPTLLATHNKRCSWLG